MEHIHQTYGVVYRHKGMIDLVHQLGFVYKKPKRGPGHPDPLRQEMFVRTYEGLKQELNPEDEIVFLGVDHRVKTDKEVRDFAARDRVYFLKRNNELGVINGTLETIRAIDGRTRELIIEIDADGPRNAPRSVKMDPTVYKAQRVTVDCSYVLASSCDDAHSTYVALSPHRQSCEVFVSREVFKNDQEMRATLSRNRPKDITLD